MEQAGHNQHLYQKPSLEGGGLTCEPWHWPLGVIETERN